MSVPTPEALGHHADDPLGLEAVFSQSGGTAPVHAASSYQTEPSRRKFQVGIDEVGRGCLAGPVVCCAFILPDEDDIPDDIRPWIRDSKKLSPRRRAMVARGLEECGAVYAYGAASVAEIDEINILRATMCAMLRAVDHLPINPDLISTILIDGEFIPVGLPAEARAIVEGDSAVPEISAASIMAKVKRDELMAALGGRYPVYAWERNAGYGTPAHLAAIRSSGLTPHHRRSFIKGR